MTPSALKTLFREDVRDTVAPFLWSNAEVWSYMDDAQKMFCRLTDGIGDATTPEVVQIPISAGDTWLELHPSILKIRAANRDSDGAPLDMLNFEDLAARGIRFEDGVTRELRLLVTGMEENKLRLVAPAAADDNVTLLVFRLPLLTITGRGDDALEIGEAHHRHLLIWMKHLAYSKQDTETFDKARADEMEARFRAYCADAKLEQARKRHKTRSVAYGGL